jgi:hypothetical protein
LLPNHFAGKQDKLAASYKEGWEQLTLTRESAVPARWSNLSGGAGIPLKNKVLSNFPRRLSLFFSLFML